MELVSKEESYAERRVLFRNIWQAALEIDEKYDTIKKPKVIKTLRLDDMDKYAIGKSKKERIKTLRAVCKKILDYCDGHDEDDFLFEQILGEQDLPTDKNGPKSIKLKCRAKKKIRRTKSLLVSPNGNTSREEAKVTTSEKKNDLPQAVSHRSRETIAPMPLRFHKTSVIRRAMLANNIPTSKDKHLSELPILKSNISIRHKLGRKKRAKRKCLSDPKTTTAALTGTWNSINPEVRGRAILKSVKELLTTNRVIVSYTTAPSTSSVSIKYSTINNTIAQ